MIEEISVCKGVEGDSLSVSHGKFETGWLDGKRIDAFLMGHWCLMHMHPSADATVEYNHVCGRVEVTSV